MPDKRWMIYGANGYTGRLLAEHAVERGHRPVLAGRSPKKILPLAERLGCEARLFPLDDEDHVARQLDGVDLVYHAAGPFTMTCRPMVHACLKSRTHYLDMTGEINVFEHTFKHGRAAERLGVLLCSGMGFDVIASDCLIAHVAAQVPDAQVLEVGINALGKASAGSTKSMLEIIVRGNRVRRGGKYTRYPFGAGARQVRFPHKSLTAVPLPWGDLSTAYRTTGIPNITTYFTFKPSQVASLRLAPLSRPLLMVTPMRRLLQRVIDATMKPPGGHVLQTDRTYLWVWVADAAGNTAEGWLETMEGYRFTAVAGVRAVEKVLEDPPAGSLTPAQVLGPDFVLDLPETVRYDTLD